MELDALSLCWALGWSDDEITQSRGEQWHPAPSTQHPAPAKLWQISISHGIGVISVRAKPCCCWLLWLLQCSGAAHPLFALPCAASLEGKFQSVALLAFEVASVPSSVP